MHIIYKGVKRVPVPENRICRKGGKRGISENLRQAVRRLNALFEDLKEVRLELNGSYIQSGELRQLEIDWGRFRKTIRVIQKHLRAGENSPKIKKEKIIFQNYII